MPRGRKSCPKCNKQSGPRLKVCSCGYVFIDSKSQIPPKSLHRSGIKGKKKCPCGTLVGLRTQVCPQCEYEFVIGALNKQKRQAERVSGKKGIKICPQCRNEIGNKTKICPHCQYFFVSKSQCYHQITNGYQVDWKTLVKGDIIKCLAGNGPHYLDQNGEKTFLSSSGKYKVSRITQNGIEAYGKRGFEFLLMVDLGLNPETQIIREPHKIRLLNKKGV